MEKLELLYIACGNVKWFNHYEKNSVAVPQKVKHRIIPWPRNSFPRCIPPKTWKQLLKQILVHKCLQQHYLQQTKSMNNPSLHQQSVVCTYTMEYCSVIRMKSDTSYHMEPWGHYAKRNRPVTNSQILYDSTLYQITGVIKFVETKSRIVVARVWGEGMGNCCLTGTEFQFYKMKRILETGYTPKWMYLTAHFKMVKMENLMYFCNAFSVFKGIKYWYMLQSRKTLKTLP